MIMGIWNTARAKKENIFYTILTIFLLERVRRGWNRIEKKGRAQNASVEEIERKQQSFTLGAALLYSLLFLLPAVKYVYRSIDELSRYVSGLAVFDSLWAFFVVLLLTEALLAVVIYNLLGIYVERMNDALGFFRKLGRSVVDGSKVAVQTVGVEAPTKLYGGVKRSLRQGVSSVQRRTRSALVRSTSGLRRLAGARHP